MNQILAMDTLPAGWERFERYWQQRALAFPELGTHAAGAQWTQETLAGCKLRVESNRILDALEAQHDRNKSVLLDAFGGSGAFSVAAALRGWRVIYNDIDLMHVEAAKNNWQQVCAAIATTDPQRAAALDAAIMFQQGPAQKAVQDAPRGAVAYMDPPWTPPEKHSTGHDHRLKADVRYYAQWSPLMREMFQKIAGRSMAFAVSVPTNMGFEHLDVAPIDGLRPDGSVAFHTMMAGQQGLLSKAENIALQKSFALGHEK